jgi:hypothetical protein
MTFRFSTQGPVDKVTITSRWKHGRYKCPRLLNGNIILNKLVRRNSGYEIAKYSSTDIIGPTQFHLCNSDDIVNS